MQIGQFTIFETNNSMDGVVQEAILSLIGHIENNPDYKEIMPAAQNSISIKEVRDVIGWLQLKPFQSANKVALIAAAEKLTQEAQNCLLKTLEEPPANSYILLTTNNSQALLPTVRSRGMLMRTQKKITEPQEDHGNSTLTILNADIKTKIKWIDTIAKIPDSYEKRQKVLQFLREVHNMIIHDPKLFKNLELISKSQEAVKRNVNVKLILENFLFNYHD